MEIKKMFKFYVISLVIIVSLFVLGIKISLYIVKKDLESYLNSNEFEKRLYFYSINSLIKFSEKKPIENDKLLIKKNLKKIFENYKDVLPNSTNE